MIVNATENSTGVVFTYNGTVNISGLDFVGNNTFPYSELCPSCGFFNGAGESPGTKGYDVYSNTSSYFPAFGSGSFILGFESTGDRFSFGFNTVYVPEGYSSITPALLSGSATFAGETFESLGMDTGTFEGTLTNGDTITLNVGTAAAVPAPLPILGLPAVLFYSRKLKKRIKASREISSASLV
jgi:hypothetical protein